MDERPPRRTGVREVEKDNKKELKLTEIPFKREQEKDRSAISITKLRQMGRRGPDNARSHNWDTPFTRWDIHPGGGHHGQPGRLHAPSKLQQQWHQQQAIEGDMLGQTSELQGEEAAAEVLVGEKGDPPESSADGSCPWRWRMRWSMPPPPDLVWPALHIAAVVVVNPPSALGVAGAGEKLSEIRAPPWVLFLSTLSLSSSARKKALPPFGKRPRSLLSFVEEVRRDATAVGWRQRTREVVSTGGEAEEGKKMRVSKNLFLALEGCSGWEKSESIPVHPTASTHTTL